MKTALAYAFREWFGLTLGPAMVLETLFRTDGAVDAQTLADAVGARRESIAVFLAHIRAALDDGAIDTINKRPPRYQLTQAGKDECRQVAAKLAAELMSVADGDPIPFGDEAA